MPASLLASLLGRLRRSLADRDGAAAGPLLDELRSLYRQDPSVFSLEALEELAAASRTLRAPRSSEALDEPASPPRPSPTNAGLEASLKSCFGFDRFRPGQRDIVDAVLAGRDVVGILPTGAGKSLTYQLPARLMGGVTLVVSPLIALMKDQVDGLDELGIRATYLNSSLQPEERRARIQDLRAGRYELVYAAPEGLELYLAALLEEVPIRLVAVDEAHCISHWGHDFRPAYRNLAGLKARFGQAPILALTATATPQVRDDIALQLGMRDPLLVQGSFFRPNLRISAYRKGEGQPAAREAILRLVQARRGASGIVYCLSRKSVESTAAWLREHGIRALPYHAGLDAETRSRAQEAFRRDDAEVIVATVAFGMGIDKSNIRFVLHRDMPKSVEGWSQEIGRAGRDGAPADCILFYSWADVLSYDRFPDGLDAALAAAQQRQTRDLYRLVENGACRHQALLAHLGERMAPCGASCDVCAGLDPLGKAPKQRKAPKGTKGTKARIFTPEPVQVPVEGEEGLYLELKALRKRLADAKGVPAYVVFTDAALLEMARLRPTTDDSFLAVSGVGPKKLTQYGDAFMEVVRQWGD